MTYFTNVLLFVVCVCACVCLRICSILSTKIHLLLAKGRHSKGLLRQGFEVEVRIGGLVEMVRGGLGIR